MAVELHFLAGDTHRLTSVALPSGGLRGTRTYFCFYGQLGGEKERVLLWRQVLQAIATRLRFGTGSADVMVGDGIGRWPSREVRGKIRKPIPNLENEWEATSTWEMSFISPHFNFTRIKNSD